jgi:hypothetical protein
MLPSLLESPLLPLSCLHCMTWHGYVKASREGKGEAHPRPSHRCSLCFLWTILDMRESIARCFLRGERVEWCPCRNFLKGLESMNRTYHIPQFTKLTLLWKPEMTHVRNLLYLFLPSYYTWRRHVPLFLFASRAKLVTTRALASTRLTF